VHGGYGIYYDRITLEIMSLERGLDGRTLPIEVRAGNVFFLPENGPPILPPFAPSLSDPFTGFILPGAGAGGINIIDNGMQNPTVQQFNLGVEHEFSGGWLARRRYSTRTARTSSSAARSARSSTRRRRRTGDQPRGQRRDDDATGC
jgi:hypothetical protein